MSKFFKPYEGKRPFLFISYAHLQSEMVLDTIKILHDSGYRLWYDEGIPPGNDWPSCIANHMRDCGAVLFFVSSRAYGSENCYSEMCAAADQGKPILVIKLEDVTAPARWSEVLKGAPELPLIEDSLERAVAILESGFVKKSFHYTLLEKLPMNAIGIGLSFIFFLASVLLLEALVSGRWAPFEKKQERENLVMTSGLTEVPISTVTPTPSPTATPTPTTVPIGWNDIETLFPVEFPDAQQEREYRRILGVSDGDILKRQLAEVKELYFCGSIACTGFDAVSFSEDGTCRVNGAPIVTGKVSDLSVIHSTVRLEKLALICQPIQDISGLDGLLLLRELSLAGSSLVELPMLENLPSLEILHLEHTNISNLEMLDNLPNLKKVTVSRDMLPLSWDKNARFEVVLIKDL